MKIGVYFSENISPEAGGGYEYIKCLLGEISQRKTEHHFVPVVLQGKKDNADISWLSAFSLDPAQALVLHEEPFRPALLLRLLHVLFRVCGARQLQAMMAERFRLLESLQQKKCREQGMQLLTQHGVEVLYYSLPYENYHPDFPFIATIWDTGHFGIGFFPDVAVRGIFEGRENYFRNILPRAGKIICESMQGIKDLERIYAIPADRLVHAPMFSGVSGKEDDDAAQRLAWLAGKNLAEGTFLFYPAQFWPHKNHVALLYALHELKTKGMAIPLVLTGSDKGNKEHILALCRKLNLENQVLFPGFVSREEILFLYRSALALVMPTFLGPTNIPLVEALALGCPIICSDFDGHREIAGDAALYVAPEDSLALAQKIELLYRQQELRVDLKEKGLARAALQLNTPGRACDSLLKAFDGYALLRRCWDSY